MNTIAPLLDSKAVAELLCCSVRTAEDHARAGSLPAVKFGDGWLFPSEALLRAVNRLAEQTAAERAAPAKPKAIKHQPVRKGPPNLVALLSQSGA